MRAIVGLLALAGCRFDFDAVPQDAAPDATEHPAPITFVQNLGAWGVVSTTTATLSFNNPVAAHDAIIVALYVKGAPVLDALTDTLDNTYQVVLGPVTDGGQTLYIAVALDSPAGLDDIDVRMTAAPNAAVELFIHEYAGIAEFDVATYGAGAMFGPDAMQSGTIATHHAGELLFGYGIGPCVHASTSFVLRTDVHGDVSEDIVVEPGTHQLTATSSCPASGDRWELLAAAFRPQQL
jgi:hypothetical protein